MSQKTFTSNLTCKTNTKMFIFTYNSEFCVILYYQCLKG